MFEPAATPVAPVVADAQPTPVWFAVALMAYLP
jgi:hypothetical protein